MKKENFQRVWQLVPRRNWGCSINCRSWSTAICWWTTRWSSAAPRQWWHCRRNPRKRQSGPQRIRFLLISVRHSISKPLLSAAAYLSLIINHDMLAAYCNRLQASNLFENAEIVNISMIARAIIAFFCHLSIVSTFLGSQVGSWLSCSPKRNCQLKQ